MSFGDRLVLWLHIAAAIFTIGPVTLAVSSTPRSIRRGDIAVLRYLSRITLVFTAAALLVLVFGLVLGNIDHAYNTAWLTISMTLFVVAIVLLVLIIRDQRKAIRTLAAALAEASGAATPVAAQGAGPVGGEPFGEAKPATGPNAGAAAPTAHIASVERGRIAALGGVVNLLWLVILVLMVWRP